MQQRRRRGEHVLRMERYLPAERPLQNENRANKLLAEYVLDIVVAGSGLLKCLYGMLFGEFASFFGSEV